MQPSLFDARWRSLLVVVPLTLGTACTKSGDASTQSTTQRDDVVAGTAVQMNDVSVLYPMANSADEAAGYLAPWSDGLGGSLFPESVYRSATGAQASSRVGQPLQNGFSPATGLDYGTMRAIAVRIDPCFGAIGPITQPDTCENQLRIVFQSLVLGADGRSQAADHSVHAFYSLTRDKLVAFVVQMTQLRSDQGQTDDMGPLAVHPLLASQGLLGPFATGLNDLIVQFAGEQNLIRFTVFSSPRNAPIWIFKGFDVAPDGTTAPRMVPTLAGSATDDVFTTPVG
jgi:hypothetical protein